MRVNQVAGPLLPTPVLQLPIGDDEGRTSLVQRFDRPHPSRQVPSDTQPAVDQEGQQEMSEARGLSQTAGASGGRARTP